MKLARLKRNLCMITPGLTITTELLKGGLIRATVQFGGIYLRLSRVLGTGASRGAGSAYYAPSNPYSGSAVKSAHVQDYDTVGNGVFTPP